MITRRANAVLGTGAGTVPGPEPEPGPATVTATATAPEDDDELLLVATAVEVDEGRAEDEDSLAPGRSTGTAKADWCFEGDLTASVEPEVGLLLEVGVLPEV